MSIFSTLRYGFCLATLFLYGIQGRSLTAEPKSEGDVLKSFLNTLHGTNHSETFAALESLGAHYELYLQEFVREPFCADFPGITLRSACAEFQASEIQRIRQYKWSSKFRFQTSEFQETMAVINFTRSARLHHSYTCLITLQLSIDLKTRSVLHDEYFGSCS